MFPAFTTPVFLFIAIAAFGAAPPREDAILITSEILLIPPTSFFSDVFRSLSTRFDISPIEKSLGSFWL